MADANRFEGSLSTRMGMYLNMLPVQGILGTVLAEPGTGPLQASRSGPIKHLNHSGELLIPVDGLCQHLEMEDKQEYRELSVEDWVAQAVEQGLNFLIAAYFAAIDELELDIVFQQLS